MKIRSKRWFSLEIEDGKINLSINLQTNKQKGGHGRLLWIKYSNTKYQQSLWGEKAKYHFCFQIPKVITLDTAHIGKKLFNSRINLTRLGNRDYHVYSSGDSVQSFN